MFEIGNNCYIGSGVKIYGVIEIGDNVGIGVNVVVNKSFFSNVIIVGVFVWKIGDNGFMDYRVF